LKGEYVDTIKNADNVVTQLTYDKDGYLKEVIQADGKRTTLTYDSAGRHFVTMIANPDASFQTNSYFDNGVLAATSTGVQSRSTRGPVTTSFTMFSYTSDTVLTTERNPANAIAKRFARVEFTDVPGVGMLASKMYASDGAYSQKDNPGVLLSSSTFGAAGQLKRTYDRFGIGTEFFYTASADCTHASNDIPEMPIATCIRSVTGTTKITYNESLLPTRVTNLNSKGDTIQTVARSYNKVGMAERESVTNAQGVEVATVTTNYGSSGFYPTSSTSRSIQTAKYDNLYRLVEAGGNNGSLTTYSYDAAGRVRSVTTNGDTQSVNQSVSDGASATTVSDGVMTTTVHTSADGLGFGVTSQRVSPNAQIVPSLMGSWGGFTADQSARASFDISSLHRTDEENEPTAPQSEVGQLMPAEVIENFTLGAVINPSRGVTTTTNHHISSPDGALNDGSSQEELWPAVAMNPAKRSTKRSGNSGIGQRRERRSVGKVTLPAAKRK
jgi:YD repeat-containing protein